MNNGEAYFDVATQRWIGTSYDPAYLATMYSDAPTPKQYGEHLLNKKRKHSKRK